MINEKLITTYLKRLGFSPSMKGYYVIQVAINMTFENPYLLLAMHKNLYCPLGVIFKVSPKCIERRMRCAIERAWLNGDLEFTEKIFQYSIISDKCKPSNRLFITTLIEYLRMEMLLGSAASFYR